MTESSEILSVIGNVLTTGRDELVFEMNEQKNVLCRNVTRLESMNEDQDRQYVIDFISRTVFCSSDFRSSATLDLDSDEGRVCQKFLEQHFGRKDESVIKFFESLENEDSDKEKFENCIKIIYQEEVGIPKSRFDSNITYYLVIGLFYDHALDEPIEKIFLQKVEKHEGCKAMITHAELSTDLYHFSQSSRVKKFMEKAIKKDSHLY